MNLSKEDKLAIYDRAIQLFEGGKNWITGSWFGRKFHSEAELKAHLLKEGWTEEELEENPYLLSEQDPQEYSIYFPNEVNCFCLQGAIAVAARDLGFVEGQLTVTLAESIAREVVPDGQLIPGDNDNSGDWKFFSKNIIPKYRKKIEELPE